MKTEGVSKKIKVFTVVGARPQFIKAAVISRLVRDVYFDHITEILVHTGQHYSKNMSDVFFHEMDIPKPSYNLEVNEKTHGAMTGKMLCKLEELMISEDPDIVLVYGDTNSTLAGALAASKLGIPLAHVESGLRSFWKKMPEEQNRIITDNLSDLLFCSSKVAVKNLRDEGITKGVINVGDIMLDSFTYYNKGLDRKKSVYSFLNKRESIELELVKDNFYLLTLHRAENTNEKVTMENIFSNLSLLDNQILFPVHPRTLKQVEIFEINIPDNIIPLEPVGYHEILNLLSLCKAVITDSGGLQKEAYYAKKQCYTLRSQTEWVETLEGNWNILCDPNKSFYQFLTIDKKVGEYNSFYGDGKTGISVLNEIIKYLKTFRA